MQMADDLLDDSYGAFFLFSFFFPLVDASLCLKASLHALQPDDSRYAPSTHNVTEEPCDTTLFHSQSVIENPDSINIAGGGHSSCFMLKMAELDLLFGQANIGQHGN
ncbi:unnamed protein product [Penicillium camemberti]|uniref:Str. FM013 n=1 Tax=Penicillium camemberti (strain FM 013) TaxID=1429867 RepID=A0A0G4NZ58_PENC3|nr:unnamed protein product [Penicillium camemberti]